MVQKYGKYLKDYMKRRYNDDLEFRERMKKHVRNYQKRNPIRTWMSRTFNSHKRRGKKLLISIKELEDLVNKTRDCFFCGEEVKYGNLKLKNGQINYNSASLDIKDITKPLSKENLHIICNFCNSAKNTKNILEFINHCKLITSRHS